MSSSSDKIDAFIGEHGLDIESSVLAIRNHWNELESDPVVFGLLCNDLMSEEVDVTEIINIQENLRQQIGETEEIYGLILLFPYQSRKSDRGFRSYDKELKSKEVVGAEHPDVDHIWFAKQKVANSCATMALLSIAMNSPNLRLNSILQEFKVATDPLDSEFRGHAVANSPHLAAFHNKRAPFDFVANEALQELQEAETAGNSESIIKEYMNSFHYVPYLPVGGYLLELDGLRENPIDHGKIGENEDWLEKARGVICNRMKMSPKQITFNLLALKKSNRVVYQQRMEALKQNMKALFSRLSSYLSDWSRLYGESTQIEESLSVISKLFRDEEVPATNLTALLDAIEGMFKQAKPGVELRVVHFQKARQFQQQNDLESEAHSPPVPKVAASQKARRKPPAKPRRKRAKTGPRRRKASDASSLAPSKAGLTKKTRAPVVKVESPTPSPPLIGIQPSQPAVCYQSLLKPEDIARKHGKAPAFAADDIPHIIMKFTKVSVNGAADKGTSRAKRRVQTRAPPRQSLPGPGASARTFTVPSGAFRSQRIEEFCSGPLDVQKVYQNAKAAARKRGKRKTATGTPLPTSSSSESPDLIPKPAISVELSADGKSSPEEVKGIFSPTRKPRGKGKKELSSNASDAFAQSKPAPPDPPVARGRTESTGSRRSLADPKPSAAVMQPQPVVTHPKGSRGRQPVVRPASSTDTASTISSPDLEGLEAVEQPITLEGWEEILRIIDAVLALVPEIRESLEKKKRISDLLAEEELKHEDMLKEKSEKEFRPMDFFFKFFAHMLREKVLTEEELRQMTANEQAVEAPDVSSESETSCSGNSPPSQCVPAIPKDGTTKRRKRSTFSGGRVTKKTR